jgi:hypothetical protein
VKRNEAEVLHDDMHEVMMKSLRDGGMEIMTEAKRKELGIPDIKDRLRESAIVSLMEVELSEQGQEKADMLLAERRKRDAIYEVRKAVTCGCGSSRCGLWNETSEAAVRALDKVDFS